MNHRYLLPTISQPTRHAPSVDILRMARRIIRTARPATIIMRPCSALTFEERAAVALLLKGV